MATNKPVKTNPTVDPSEFHTLEKADAGDYGADSLVSKFDPNAFVQAARAGFVTEKVVVLQEGQMTQGIFSGRGPDVEIEDAGTGEIRKVPTWKIRHPATGIYACVLGGAQLDKTFGAMAEGTEVLVAKLAQVSTRKGRRVNDYAVSVKRS